uniref:Uncharacterized protein n=1 Tax=Arundo donax TaxID=35708 RepID=A0A0A9EF45_ARUDO
MQVGTLQTIQISLSNILLFTEKNLGTLPFVGMMGNNQIVKLHPTNTLPWQLIRHL